MRDQPTVGGRSEGRKKPNPSEEAPTQISGGAPPADASAGRTMPAASPSFPPLDRAAIRFGAPPAAPAPAEHAADETVVMELQERALLPLAWVAILEGPGGKRGKTVTLSTETIIGRNQGELQLAGDRGVSTQHLKIRLEAQEAGKPAFVAYDQATTNGTYIGGRENYRDEASRVYRRELKDGDYLLLGDTTLVFKQVD